MTFAFALTCDSINVVFMFVYLALSLSFSGLECDRRMSDASPSKSIHTLPNHNEDDEMVSSSTDPQVTAEGDKATDGARGHSRKPSNSSSVEDAMHDEKPRTASTVDEDAEVRLLPRSSDSSQLSFDLCNVPSRSMLVIKPARKNFEMLAKALALLLRGSQIKSKGFRCKLELPKPLSTRTMS